MKVGVLGYAGVGKSTVFAALTEMELSLTGETRRAVVPVADPRLDHLGRVFQPKKFTPARFDIEECPALPSSSAKGRGGVIDALREPDALLLVIGSFEQALMMLDDDLHDPVAQLRSLRDELLLLDLEVVEQRLDRVRERLKRGAGDQVQLRREASILETVLAAVEADEGIPESSDREWMRLVADLSLFAEKPLIPVLNIDEGAGIDVITNALGSAAHGAAVMSATVEYEIGQVEADERSAFLEEYGLDAPASERLTRLAYNALDLISFFTVGEDEVRAWPLRRGSNAVTAAGKVHTDLARGFIRAEVTPYERVRLATNAREFKEMGSADLRGKDYIVQDGDTINIRFSI